MIYEIYPRSFYDSNNDGIGDLAGVTAKLDHVAALGVDAIWLAPHYVSPWADGGYDIADYAAVEPRLGTLADFDTLVQRAHQLGLKVMVDQVLNHSSAAHPWFRAACDGDDAMAERYLFRDPKADGTAPNNWLSFFGIPAWTWCHTRRQYYFHQYLTSQPSLNLRNPDVQAALRDQIAFWQRHGVDGFRFDTVTSFLWDESLADNPPARPAVKAKMSGMDFNPYTWQDHAYDMLPGDGAAYAEQLRDWAGEDAYLIGEIGSGNKSYELAMAFSEAGRLNASYTIDLPETRASPETLAQAIAETDLTCFVGWMGSHDQPRHNQSGTATEAMFFALLMAFLPGPWLIYQGDEWGLTQPDLNKHYVTDPYDLLYWPDGPGREGARVPLPWDGDAAHMGFSDAAPWLPMNWSRTAAANGAVATQVAAFYSDVIAQRRGLGWDLGDIVVHDHAKEWIHLHLTAHGVTYAAYFRFSAAAPPVPDHDVPDIVTVPATAGCGYAAAVWRIGDGTDTAA